MSVSQFMKSFANANEINWTIDSESKGIIFIAEGSWRKHVNSNLLDSIDYKCCKVYYESNNLNVSILAK